MPKDPLVGRTIAGAFRLGELIGVGGMGRVYRAEQNTLGRAVAVKVIHPHLHGDETTVARFYNEARAASRLNHPNSVSIIDFGRTEDGMLFLVMEHLDGKDLAHVLAEEGPLPFLRICRIVRYTLSALGEAHALGVVHRDLKPENIIVKPVRRGAEHVKVVDFGLAHIVESDTSISAPGLVCGTPDYMAPEQGAGDPVDGRGDLYAVGVVLYEMLTDQLPFVDDNPTKVIYKHIHEAVPDPRQVAPYRDIPDSLARICLRALEKDPDDRYPTADAMFEAMLREEQRLEHEKSDAFIRCPSCGASNPRSVRFCGECGARITKVIAVPERFRSGVPGRSTLSPRIPDGPLIGRAETLEQLAELRKVAKQGPVWVRIWGEPGVGKSRLLHQFGEERAAAADVVVSAAPHPSGTPVPYWPIRTLLAQLLQVDRDKLDQVANLKGLTDPAAQAGVRELLESEGVPGAPGRARVTAVAIALAAAVRSASHRENRAPVVLLIDDLPSCDALSAQVIAQVLPQLQNENVFICTSGRRRTGSARASGQDDVDITLQPLTADGAHQLLDLPPDCAPPSLRNGEHVSAITTLPLYVEQLRALGYSGLGEADAPRDLTDAVLQRLERLNRGARRLVQLLAILGRSAPMSWVEELASPEEMDAILPLVAEGLLVVDNHRLGLSHPFIGELAKASIPAAVRRALHIKAFALCSGHATPLEVRAHHALGSGEPMTALVLLERAGDKALQRGDAEAAVSFFRSGLELARRELLMTGDTALDGAIVTFSRKLGDAMTRAGNPATAHGVLMEALELAGAADRERTRMLLALGRAAQGRERFAEAERFFVRGIDLATTQREPALVAEGQLLHGELLLRSPDPGVAERHLLTAVEQSPDTKEGSVMGIRAALALGRARVSMGRFDEAKDALTQAEESSEQTGLAGLQAEVAAALAAVYARQGAHTQAAQHYRDAGRLAAQAGDVDRAHEWHRLGRISDTRHAELVP